MANPETSPEPAEALGEIHAWTMFVPQKAKALRRAKILALAGMLGIALLIAAGIALLLTGAFL